jgi:YVTN family beta-propeller protein
MRQFGRSRSRSRVPSPLVVAGLVTLAVVLPAAVGGAGSAAASPAAGYTAAYISTAGTVMPGPVAVDAVTDTIYCAGYNPNDIDEYELAVVDGSSGTVVATLAVASYPSGIAVDSATDTIYVADGNKVVVVNGATDTATATIALPTGTATGQIAVDSTTDTIYVANDNASDGSVVVIDGSNNAVTTTVSSGGTSPYSIAVDEATNVIWVANQGGTVVGISGATGSIIDSVSPNGDPNDVAVDEDTDTVYVSTSAATNGLTVIDGATGEITATMPVEVASLVAVDQSADVVFAQAEATYGGSTAYGTVVIDGTTNAVTDVLDAIGEYSAVDSATSTLYETPANDFPGLWAITPSTANGVSPLASGPGSDSSAGTAVVGVSYSAQFTASGEPLPTFTENGPLPSGITLNPDGLLSGTPAAGTEGVYPITVVASNGIAPDFSLPFTLNVDEVPSITSAGEVTFNTGAAGSFTVTATGFPAPVLSESGALPAGVTFDSTDGVLAGTPAAGTAGRYPILMSASNAGGITSQQFTLVVAAAGESLGLPAGGVLGDVTGNGRADLLGIDPSGNLWLYPNTGSANAGMFAGGRSQVGSGWTRYTLAAVTPLYGSARAGLLAIAPGGNLWYYPNTATTGTSVTFGGRSLVGTGWTGYTVVGVTDLYVTGQLGILAIDPSGNLWWYPTTGGTGTSTFGGRSLVGIGWTGYTADVADINLSTSPDLLAIDSSGNMWLYPSIGGGTGTSTFGSPTLLGVGWSGYQAVDAGLLTTSSYADVLAIDPEGNLWYYPNNDGLIGSTFGTPLEIGPGWTGYRIN